MDVQQVKDKVIIESSPEKETSPPNENELIKKLKELFDATEYKIN